MGMMRIAYKILMKNWKEWTARNILSHKKGLCYNEFNRNTEEHGLGHLGLTGTYAGPR
jgi:hypothetical protein